MLFSSALVSVAGLASLLTLGLANPTGLAPSGAEAPQWCCNCESCTNCDASCPDPGCGLFVGFLAPPRGVPVDNYRDLRTDDLMFVT